MVNRAFGEVRGRPSDDVAGQHFTELTHPDQRASDAASFDRLVSGELDHLEITVRRIVSDGRELVYMSHRSAVRGPDASLRYIVTVARPLRVPESDYPAVGSVVYRPTRIENEVVEAPRH